MQLTCICGRAGSGKSRFLAQVTQRALAQGRRVYLLVPDQYTLQAERELMAQLQAPGLLQVEVLSFTRLCQRVLEHCGCPSTAVLDARGRAMAVSGVLIEQQHALEAYGRYVHSPNFCATLAGEIAELKRFDVSPQQFAQAAQDQVRLRDIARVYEAYEQKLQGVYNDNEDALNWMIERIPSASFLQGAVVMIDGFEMLTSQIYRTVDALLRTAHNLCTTFRIGEPTDPDFPLFATEEKHLLRMQQIAQRAGARIVTVRLPQQFPTLAPRHRRGSGLAHLERNLFAAQPQVYSAVPSDVHVLSAPTPAREVEACAAQILTLVRDAQVRFSDIAVVAADLASYGPLLQHTFVRYGIPSFLDSKRTVAAHPLARYALLSLRVIQSGFAARDVLALMKTGMSALSMAQCDELQEIVRTCGVRFLPENDGRELGELHQAYHGARHVLLDAQYALRHTLESAQSAAEQAEAFATFLQASGLIDRANALMEQQHEAGALDRVQQTRMVYQVLCNLLTQMHDVLGQKRLSVRAFYDVLAAGLSAEEVGVLPATQDAVHVGTLSRSRTGDLHALFVLGVNEGVIPQQVEEAGLFTREDLARLSEEGVYLGHSPLERAEEESLTLYGVLTKPKAHLYLSYPLAGTDGSAKLPSSLIESLRACMPQLRIRPAAQTAEACIQTPASTKLPLMHALRNSRRAHTPLPGAYARALSTLAPAFSPQLRQALDAQGAPASDDIGPALAQALFAGAQVGSVTALEELALCPFRHFLERAILQPPPKKDYGHDALDNGNYYHEITDRYLEALMEQPQPFALTRAQSDALLDALCETYEQDAYLTGAYRLDGRAHAQARRQRQALKHACWSIVRQLDGTAFAPVSTESKFLHTLTLPDGRQFTIAGRIDRVDLAQTPQGRYVRVIDYKSRGRDFSLTGLYYGASLQLPLYASAAAERQQAQSAGMFFMPMQQNAPAVPPAQAQQARQKQYLLCGYCTQEGIDCAAGAAETTIKGAKPGRYTRILDRPTYQALLDYGRQKATELLSARQQGVTRPMPLKGEIDACRTCPFAYCCQFDLSQQGGRVTTAKGKQDFSKEEVQP